MSDLNGPFWKLLISILGLCADNSSHTHICTYTIHQDWGANQTHKEKDEKGATLTDGCCAETRVTQLESFSDNTKLKQQMKFAMLRCTGFSMSDSYINSTILI